MPTQQPIGPSPSPSSAEEIQLVQVPPEEVDQTRHLWGAELRRAIARAAGRISEQDVVERATLGELQLWLGYEGDTFKVVVVTEIAIYPTNRRICSILLLAGEGVHRWAHEIDTLERFARAEDCDAIEIHGRPGWGRIYPDYRPIFTVFEKEL